jgi:predicted ester cyclase
MVDELHAPLFVDHDSAGRTSDRQGFKAGIVQLYAAFPDFYAVVEDLVVDTAAMKVAVRWVASGTHQGVFMGIPPTGRRIAFQGIEIIRIEGERIAERWGEWNGIDLLEVLR